MTVQLLIGTRGSPLALAQARWVQARLEAHHPHLQVTLTIIKTTGDKILDVPLAQVGGKGLFTKEIEQALLAREVDLGVHSMKDVPAELPAGLTISTITTREDWRDALISHRYPRLEDIPAGGRIGTSSLRRRAQLLHQRPDLNIVPLRGNVDTRLRKLAEENLDAIILAVAGLKRLGLEHLITSYLPAPQMLPAIGQGALGLELRRQDTCSQELVACLDDPASRVAVRAERAFLARLQGGCQVPVAALGLLTEGRLTLEGLISDPEGRLLLREKVEGIPKDAETLGTSLAESLLDQGGREILSQIYGRPLNI
ncbi:MAG: hydroxymethylbilane synthase [Deltaproteobacteria bacterium]|nr:hydroxymethylbilane synthase [Deltaproteobacteria bacterium]MBW1986303.1 hydroxymethylbilane synthase [Deltaproteobacteria bacterium]MBW2134344.1 hydroxymethylbilane synthase [Deltaproteobacteria bacterium]